MGGSRKTPAKIPAALSLVTPPANRRRRQVKGPPPSPAVPASGVAKRAYVYSEIEDEGEDEGEDDFDVSMKGPMPPRKKIQSSRMLTIVVPPWVPQQMKIDLMDLHSGRTTTTGKIELLGCLRFYVRVILMQKRNITLADRIDFAVCFGVTEDDATAYESGISRRGEAEKPWGVVISDRLKSYYHGMLAKLRDNFDLLLKMFWSCEDAKLWIRGQMIMVEAAQQAALLNERGINMRLNRAPGNTPLIDWEDIDALFLKGNMKLVSDVWGHILDVVEPGFLLKDCEWGKKMLRSTCIILAWYITYLFQLLDPKGAIEETATGIETTDKTAAIHKGDLGLSTEWPPLKLPVKWGRRSTVPWYGELVGGKGFQDPIREDLENGLAMASATEGGCLLSVLDDDIDAEAEKFRDILLSRAGHLEELGRKAIDKAKDVKDRASELIRGMKDSKIYTERVVKQRMATEAIDQFCKSAWIAYEEAKRSEKRRELEGIGPGTEVLEVIGTCHIWMENLKKMGVFKELGVEYENSFGVASKDAMQGASNRNPVDLQTLQQMAAFWSSHQHMFMGGGTGNMPNTLGPQNTGINVVSDGHAGFGVLEDSDMRSRSRGSSALTPYSGAASAGTLEGRAVEGRAVEGGAVEGGAVEDVAVEDEAVEDGVIEGVAFEGGVVEGQ